MSLSAAGGLWPLGLRAVNLWGLLFCSLGFTSSHHCILIAVACTEPSGPAGTCADTSAAARSQSLCVYCAECSCICWGGMEYVSVHGTDHPLCSLQAIHSATSPASLPHQGPTFQMSTWTISQLLSFTSSTSVLLSLHRHQGWSRMEQQPSMVW